MKMYPQGVNVRMCCLDAKFDFIYNINKFARFFIEILKIGAILTWA